MSPLQMGGGGGSYDLAETTNQTAEGHISNGGIGINVGGGSGVSGMSLAEMQTLKMVAITGAVLFTGFYFLKNRRG